MISRKSLERWFTRAARVPLSREIAGRSWNSATKLMEIGGGNVIFRLGEYSGERDFYYVPFYWFRTPVNTEIFCGSRFLSPSVILAIFVNSLWYWPNFGSESKLGFVDFSFPPWVKRIVDDLRKTIKKDTSDISVLLFYLLLVIMSASRPGNRTNRLVAHPFILYTFLLHATNIYTHCSFFLAFNQLTTAFSTC